MTNYSEYSLASSLSFLADSQAAISNNVANATTSGYKRKTPIAVLQRTEFQSLLGTNLPSVRYSERTDFTPGSQRTSHRMNVAIGKDQFFRVKSNNGTFYTQRGEFIVNKSGELVTPNGETYLSIGGQLIRVNDAQEIRIQSDGTVLGKREDTELELGRLGIFQIPDQTKLTSIGRSLYFDKGNQEITPHAAGTVRQGYIEESNVDVLSELVQMISVQRSFGATTKAMTTIDRIQDSFIQTMSR